MNPPIIFICPVSSLPPRQPAKISSDNETRQGKYVKIGVLPKGEFIMEIKNIQIQKPEEINFILGQSHFIKTVEDLHETLVTSVPGIKFGLAFCEASGDCLVRWSGTDDAMIELARQNAKAIGAGHSFIVFLGEGYFPINILNQVKMVPEVCRIYCATANPTDVIVMDVGEGRAILGVADGKRPEGIEDEEGIAWRKNFLRMIGYKH